MKNIILTIAFIGAVWSFPKDEELRFKNVYVNSRVPVSEHIVSRIVNGHEVVPHSIPYQAYLYITDNDGYRWLCGGSLISPSYVLTAAHCIINSISANVYLGIHNTEVPESTSVVITSNNFIYHENFNDYFISNDIGLIELPTPVQLNEYVNVAHLPRRGDSTDYEGANARVSGWGLTDGHGAVSSVLREVNSTVISNRQCDSIFGIVGNSQVCISGDGGVSACNGDSGGPLVTGDVQIGIVSYGVEYCVAGYPSAFTRITSFLDWLERHTDLKF